MSEKISIIIPVYKVEQYLPECIESIINQTYHDLEIILVDDGSPDKCGEICDQYARQDERIHVIHKENGGVARARNDGIEYASGDYISFIDSDDWIAENAYELLHQGLKQYDADCAVGKCVTVIDENGVLTPKKNAESSVRCETASEAMKHVLLSGSAVWNRLFKREVFKQIRFPIGRVNDDEVVALHAYAECKKIVFLDQDTYYYRIRQNSITTSKFSLRNVDCYYNSVDNLEFVRQRQPELVECAEYKCIKAMLYCYVNLRKLKGDPEAKKIRHKIHEEIRQKKSAAYANQYVSLAMKVLMFVCAI
ncbi:MAG: glycosyltransferase family 2 protein [Acetatifactor sp.]|nr:glycosyltransferase family 2 protein [Acetatifactor sp.]